MRTCVAYDAGAYYSFCTLRTRVLRHHYLSNLAVRVKAYFMPRRSARSKAGCKNIEKAAHVQGAQKQRHKLVCVAVVNWIVLFASLHQRATYLGHVGIIVFAKTAAKSSWPAAPLARYAAVLAVWDGYASFS